MSTDGVSLNIQSDYVTMDNGIVQVTLSIPDGNLTNIKYNGIDNLLEDRNDEDDRGYWDLNWNVPRSDEVQFVIKGTSFEVILDTEEQVELSFTRMWDSSLEGLEPPLNIDKRFVMLKGSSGFYSYAIYECLEGWPEFDLYETRIVFKLTKDKFQYMAIADNRQRVMPLPDDRLTERCEVLAYNEAVRFTDPINPDLKGEVDDKYQYSIENKDNQVHGWICTNDQPTGFWQITPSNEFRSCGPIKQDLTSHVGPITLAMFLSTHYVGEDIHLKFRDGEPWKKVFGPVFIYVNSVPKGDDAILSLWEDTKKQMMTEVQSWPYSFPESKEFQKSVERGSIHGRLLVLDRCVNKDRISAKCAYVGLAPPGEAGSWQTECKGYQFWTRADDDGYFSIYNIRTGCYNLYAWVPGFIGDYKYSCEDDVITITSGTSIEKGDLVYEPPRDGPTLWEIGIPDRSAAKFYVPDPDPKYINSLYVNHPDRFRQYGLWSRYADLYPNEDLVYIVGVSDYTTDWFFAQVTRKIDDDDDDDNIYVGTTWQIRFELENVDVSSTYKLRVALASSTLAELQVRVNDPDTTTKPLFTSGLIGRDNSVARHGIHGLYWLYNISVEGSLLVEGENTLFFTQPRCNNEFQSVMYDYIRFEGPSGSLII